MGGKSSEKSNEKEGTEVEAEVESSSSTPKLTVWSISCAQHGISTCPSRYTGGEQHKQWWQGQWGMPHNEIRKVNAPLSFHCPIFSRKGNGAYYGLRVLSNVRAPTTELPPPPRGRVCVTSVFFCGTLLWVMQHQGLCCLPAAVCDKLVHPLHE